MVASRGIAEYSSFYLFKFSLSQLDIHDDREENTDKLPNRMEVTEAYYSHSAGQSPGTFSKSSDHPNDSSH